MAACKHTRTVGQTRCKLCMRLYMRGYRKTRDSLLVVTRDRESREQEMLRSCRLQALRDARIVLLEIGDLKITGFDAADAIRGLIGLD